MSQFLTLSSPNGSLPSTPKSDSELLKNGGKPDNPEMLWTWGELPHAAKVQKSLEVTHCHMFCVSYNNTNTILHSECFIGIVHPRIDSTLPHICMISFLL